jgi:hypothetical protein
MGLFSYVKLELPCPYCGHTLKEFQSKDGILMTENEPWTLRNFYSSCDKCRNWVEYVRKGTELSNIDLIHEGKQAVNLLRKRFNFNQLDGIDLEEDNRNLSKALDWVEEVKNFLKECHYPDDNSNWLDWYDLKPNKE